MRGLEKLYGPTLSSKSLKTRHDLALAEPVIPKPTVREKLWNALSVSSDFVFSVGLKATFKYIFVNSVTDVLYSVDHKILGGPDYKKDYRDSRRLALIKFFYDFGHRTLTKKVKQQIEKTSLTQQLKKWIQDKKPLAHPERIAGITKIGADYFYLIRK
jgi:hypothetical protein